MITKQIRFILSLSFAISIIFIAFFFKFNFYGFDFKDEGYYLFSISDPWAYDSTASQFGLVFHPLFELTGRSIGWFRVAGSALFLLINTLLSYCFLNYFRPPDRSLPKTWFWILSWLLASASLSAYSLWLPTPNYNLLNYQALSLTILGMFVVSAKKRAASDKKDSDLLGWLLIGAGGFLCFMAKPTTAAALAALVLAWVWLSGNFKPAPMGAAALTALVLLFCAAMVLDGSVAGFIARYKRALFLVNLSGSHSSGMILNFDFAFFSRLLTTSAKFILALFAFFGTLGLRFSQKGQSRALTRTLAAAWAAAALLIFYAPLREWRQFAFPGHFVWAPAFGAFICLLAARISESQKTDLKKAAWPLFFTAIAFIYGLGSNNQITFTLSVSAFFLCLAFLSYILQGAQNNWLLTAASIIIVTQGAAMTAIVFAWNNPYGQPEPLWRFEAESEIPMGGGRLKTAASADEFINSWYDGAQEAGYVKGTPIIDLTGNLPGALYIIGGILPNVPWLGSGYPGAETGAALVLSRIPCPQLAQAWLITDLNFQGILNPEVLSAAGLEYQGEYRLAKAAGFPIRMGRLTINRPVGLMAPVRPPASRAESCQEKRNIFNSERSAPRQNSPEAAPPE